MCAAPGSGRRRTRDISGGTGDGLLTLPFAISGPQRRVTASCAAPSEPRAASSAASFATQAGRPAATGPLSSGGQLPIVS
jgi:hypothetical protein